MNRLIIVGNGFDLAHKMKTSYNDFIVDYVKKSFITACMRNSFEDELMLIERHKHIAFPEQEIENYKDISNFKVFIKASNSFPTFSGDDYETEYRYAFRWDFNNEFIRKIFLRSFEYKWVDIENEYYDNLKKLLAIKREEEKVKELQELNKSFQFLITLLEKYLSDQAMPKIINEYLNIFIGKIIKDEVVTTKLQKDKEPVNSLLLNFNYTSTLESYDLYFKSSFDSLKRPKIIHIHGELDTIDNPIVFGFGDELDDDFKKIEGEKMKGFLNYVKSFAYFKTMNYHDLIRFIESDNFQIFILGHSCGLSDRTMLNMIFEHVNCKSIKIFYHGTKDQNNFTDLTQEISRHFTNKTEMRRRIVSFTQSLAMPQAQA